VAEPNLVKFPHDSLGVGGWPLGYEERRCWAYWPFSEFPRFPTYVITINQRHRQTDGQHVIARPWFALQCIAR